jgi:hypothetical protein
MRHNKHSLSGLRRPPANRFLLNTDPSSYTRCPRNGAMLRFEVHPVRQTG